MPPTSTTTALDNLSQSILGSLLVVALGAIAVLFWRLVKSHEAQVELMKACADEMDKARDKHEAELARLNTDHRQEILRIYDQAQKEMSDLQKARVDDAASLAEKTYAILQKTTDAFSFYAKIFEQSLGSIKTERPRDPSGEHGEARGRKPTRG